MVLILLDLFCVDCYCVVFCYFVVNYIDILLVNEVEIIVFYEIEDFDEVVCLVGCDVGVVVIICSEKGVVIVCGDEVVLVVVVLVF